MAIPFIDLQKVNARFNADDAILRVLRSGHYLNGFEVEAFEHEYAQFCGTAHCVSLANGLDGLRLTLRAWMSMGKLAPGDEVLVPANSFIASALAVTESGLRVGFMDVDPSTFNVTAAGVLKAITERTRVVMPVHLYGQLADIETIRTLCRGRGLLLLEDAAQAHGALCAATRAGAYGDAGSFSFYPTKNLGALGDAGCIVTNDAELATRVRALCNYGAAIRYRHEYPGTNSRMDELQAAFLRLKLRGLDDDNERRRVIAARYRRGIVHPLVTNPADPAAPGSHVWHLYVVSAANRDALARYLGAEQIQTIVHYPCTIHQQPVYRAAAASGSAPVAERLQHQVLSLPISPVMDEQQVDRVIDAVNAWPGR